MTPFFITELRYNKSVNYLRREYNTMTTMISEIYDAFISAGADEEKARKAAEAVAEHEKRFDHIDKELVVLKWMMGVMLTGVISLVLKAFFI